MKFFWLFKQRNFFWFTLQGCLSDENRSLRIWSIYISMLFRFSSLTNILLAKWVSAEKPKLSLLPFSLTQFHPFCVILCQCVEYQVPFVATFEMVLWENPHLTKSKDYQELKRCYLTKSCLYNVLHTKTCESDLIENVSFEE